MTDIENKTEIKTRSSGARFVAMAAVAIAAFLLGRSSVSTDDANTLAAASEASQSPWSAAGPSISPEPELEETLEDLEITISEPNSAGGVDVWICARNAGSDNVKYITYTVEPLNRVDDVVTSEIGGKSSARLKYTGPLGEGEAESVGWETVWYNSTITHVEVTGIDVEYVNGETASFVSVDGVPLIKGSPDNPTFSSLYLRCE